MHAIAVISDQIARHFSGEHEVIVYGGPSSSPNGETVGRIHYRPIALPSPWYAKALSTLDYVARNERAVPYLFGTRFYCPRYVFRLARFIRRDRVDVLHLHNFFQAVPLIRALNPRLTIVLHMHVEWLPRVNRRFGARCLGGVDLVLGCSRYVAEQLRAAYPHFADRIETVYNGVDVARFAPDARCETGCEDERVLYVGRISPEKGLHTAIDAMQDVVTVFPGSRLEIAGPDTRQARHHLAALRNPLVDPDGAFDIFYRESYLAHLRARAEAQAPGHVDFSIGFIPHQELPARFAGATMLVNPSLSETFGMTLIEAMAVGLPVIATRVGGIVEVVDDGVTGILVAPNDPRALAAAICALLREPQRAKEMGAAGRSRVLQHFTWERVLASYETLVLRAMRLRGALLPVQVPGV
jgi:glycosyltransferase involved in cell wall biosynthesis